MKSTELSPGFFGSPIREIEEVPHGLRLTLECGHVCVASKQRVDLFEAFEDKTPVHCWSCDREARGRRE